MIDLGKILLLWGSILGAVVGGVASKKNRLLGVAVGGGATYFGLTIYQRWAEKQALEAYDKKFGTTGGEYTDENPKYVPPPLPAASDETIAAYQRRWLENN